MRTVLTIAGSDCSGGAGIQADLKTITAHGLYGMSIITALTAQNTTKVFEVVPVSAAFVKRQLDAVFSDIYPDVVKIGMVSSAEIIETIAERLSFYKAPHIVLDPVMIATSGRKLLGDEGMDKLKNKLIPIANLITPNVQEAEQLSGIQIQHAEDMILAAQKIQDFCSGSVLIKGGHMPCSADDLLYSDGKIVWFRGARIGDKDRHGTGCTLSSAIACGLAKHLSLEVCIEHAKNYVAGALERDTYLGQGSSPLDHSYRINEGE